MKKLITLFTAFTLVAATELKADPCTDGPQLYLGVFPSTSLINVSGSGAAAFPFQIDLALPSWAPDCNGSSITFDLTLNLRNASWTTVSTCTYTNVVCYSFNTLISCPGWPCGQVHSYSVGPVPNTPFLGNCSFPNQSCGQYMVEAVISNVSHSGMVPSPRQMLATNVGGGTTSCTLNPGGSCSLGSIAIVNFSGTGSLTASMSSTTACAGNNGTATITPSGGTTPYTYSWLGTSSSASTATSLPSGTYTATATDANGCAVSGTATVGELSFSLSPASQTVCLDKCLLLVATVSATVSYTVTWTQSIGGGGPTTIGTGDEICVRPTSLSRTTPTVNTYTATVTDGAGCTLTQSITITVDPTCTVSYYNGCCTDPDARVASPNENQQGASLSISPNPATQETNIAFNLPSGNGRIEIYSADGRLVKRIDDIHDGGTVKLMTDEFASGVYSVILLDGDAQVQTEKLVIAE